MTDRAEADMRPDLLVDLGGTNSRVGLARDGVLIHDSIRRIANGDRPSLASVLHSYLAEETGPRPRALAVALAGPVEGRHGAMTNLAWQIDADGLMAEFGLERAELMNDLQAQALALPRLDDGALRPLLAAARPPAPALRGERLVAGIGTGFNAAMLFGARPGRGAFSPASESGHVNMVVQDEDDLALARFLAGPNGFASAEDVLSGRGLAAVHRFAAERAGAPLPDDWQAAQAVAAIARAEAPALHAARLFTRQLGAVLGNLALVQLPRGGIVLAGGVARAMAPHLAACGLADAFRDKGRFGPFMEQFSISVLDDDFAALTGCAEILRPAGA